MFFITEGIWDFEKKFSFQVHNTVFQNPNPEDGSSMFLPNNGIHLQKSKPRKPQCE
jgi:hypothetical protein